MISFFRLIRLPNLLIIAFTQYMIRFCLIDPILNQSGFQLQMPEWEFALLVIATVFISAAGYIINDYFDIHIDSINKPSENVIDKHLGRQFAILAHGILSSIGVAIGIFVAWRSNILLTGGVLFTVSVIALWFYSTTYKYRFLSGNILVSLLTAIVPFMVVLFEIPRVIIHYNAELIDLKVQNKILPTNTILLWAGSYSVAAFMLSLIREIIKDMEDTQGDKEYGCRTIPIVLGIKKTKGIVSVLILLFMGGIGYVQKMQLDAKDMLSFSYFLIFVQFPLLFILLQIIKAADKKHFHLGSISVKAVMLSGIFFLFLLRFVFLN